MLSPSANVIQAVLKHLYPLSLSQKGTGSTFLFEELYSRLSRIITIADSVEARKCSRYHHFGIYTNACPPSSVFFLP